MKCRAVGYFFYSLLLTKAQNSLGLCININGAIISVANCFLATNLNCCKNINNKFYPDSKSLLEDLYLLWMDAKFL